MTAVPERVAALAHGPPDEPAGPRAAGGHDPAARELHRTGPLPPGPRHGGAPGGVDGAHAAGAQRAAPRRRLRPGVPGVTARRRGAPPGPPGAGHDPRRSLPYPAIVVRPHGILVTANRAFDVFNEGVDPALLAPPANMFRHALHPNGLAPRVRNLPEWGRHITEHLRAVLARSPDPALEELLAELEGYLPPLRRGGRRARLRRAAGAGLGRWRPPAHHDDHVVRDRRRRDARRAAAHFS